MSIIRSSALLASHPYLREVRESALPPRRSQPLQLGPDLPPEKAYAALSEQLNALKHFQGAPCEKAKAAEDEWYVLTEKLILRSFGSGSTNLAHFRHCKSVGPPQTLALDYGFGGQRRNPPDVSQPRFEARLQCYESVLKSCIAELKIDLPEQEIKGVYEPGQEYEFYRDVKAILGLAQAQLLVIDPYLSAELFNLYADAIPRTVDFRLLSANVPQGVKALAQKYASGGNFEFRSSNSIHDRVIFVDRRVWLLGQSIKDAAKKKPTYIVEHDESIQRGVYEQLWRRGSPVI